jgi:hypothetical protein
VIGVYEPMVVVDHVGARCTSRAAEPGFQRAGEARYHGSCYERARKGQAGSGPPGSASPPVDGR